MGFTVVLVNLFPAKRTKDIILYLSICFGIFIYLIFRLMRPEDLVNPDKYGHFIDYLSSLATPAAPYIPAAWASNLLSYYLLDREIDFLLISSAHHYPIGPFLSRRMGHGALVSFRVHKITGILWRLPEVFQQGEIPAQFPAVDISVKRPSCFCGIRPNGHSFS